MSQYQKRCDVSYACYLKRLSSAQECDDFVNFGGSVSKSDLKIALLNGELHGPVPQTFMAERRYTMFPQQLWLGTDLCSTTVGGQPAIVARGAFRPGAIRIVSLSRIAPDLVVRGALSRTPFVMVDCPLPFWQAQAIPVLLCWLRRALPESNGIVPPTLAVTSRQGLSTAVLQAQSDCAPLFG
jgi:hypothetical protein